MTRTQTIKRLEKAWGFPVAWREIKMRGGTKDFSIDILQSRGGDPRGRERTTVGFGPTFEAAVTMAEGHMKSELARIAGGAQ